MQVRRSGRWGRPRTCACERVDRAAVSVAHAAPPCMISRGLPACMQGSGSRQVWHKAQATTSAPSLRRPAGDTGRGHGGGAHSQQLVVGGPGAAGRLGCAVHGCVLAAVCAQSGWGQPGGLVGSATPPSSGPALTTAAACVGWQAVGCRDSVQWAERIGRSSLHRHLSGARSGADTPLPRRGCPRWLPAVFLRVSKVPGTALKVQGVAEMRWCAATHGQKL